MQLVAVIVEPERSGKSSNFGQIHFRSPATTMKSLPAAAMAGRPNTGAAI